MKYLLLPLFFVSNIYPMQNSRYIPPLVSLCLEKIIREIASVRNQQCDLLAQKIDAQFPHESLNKYTDMVNAPLEKQLDLFTAITTLNKIATITQENEQLRITPILIQVKKLPVELNEKLNEKLKYQGQDRHKEIEQLYTKSSVVKRCMDIYMHYHASWDHVLLTTTGVKDIPVGMQLFSSKKNREAREAKEKASEKRYRYDDSWCP